MLLIEEADELDDGEDSELDDEPCCEEEPSDEDPCCEDDPCWDDEPLLELCAIAANGRAATAERAIRERTLLVMMMI
jgi:hypothetical protein